MNDKHDQRVRLTIRQLEVFSAIARGGTTHAAAGQVARSQSAASNALSELEITLGVQVFDRVGRRLVLNENGRALLPHAASIVEQAIETEAMFAGDHAAALRLASSYTIGEYLLPELIAAWKLGHPRGAIKLSIANTFEVFDSVASFMADVGFIEGQHSHPDLIVRRWRTDALAVIASPDHPFAKRRPSIAQLGHALWILREPGSGTREAVDSVHLMPPLVERNEKPVIAIVDGGQLYDAMSAGLMDRGVCVFRNCARGTRALVRYVEARHNAETLRSRRDS